MMQLRDIELDFDLFDADDAQRYEAALDLFTEAAKAVPPNATLAESIRYQCGMVFDFFDDLFGADFHKQVFGTRTNLIDCLDAFEAFTKQAQAQKTALDGRVSALQAQAGGRTARRAATRATAATA